MQVGWCDPSASDVIRDPVSFSPFPPLCELHPKATLPHGGQMAAEVPGITSSHRREQYDINSSLDSGRPAFSEGASKPLLTFH